MIVIRKKIQRIKKLINALNFTLVHTKLNAEADVGNVCSEIKQFVCEICDMCIEKFLQAEKSLEFKGMSGSVKDQQKVLRLMKTLYGMADEMDTRDFHIGNKDKSTSMFPQ